MKKYFNISNLIFLILVFWILSFRMPEVFKNFKLQGTSYESEDTLEDINGQKINLKFPLALIFWASWCKPCEIELSRIQEMINEKKISPEKIIAISIDQTLDPIKLAVGKGNYTFNVVWDKDRSISSKYNISSTPTTVLVSSDKKNSWVTSGISPSLEWRLANHLK